MSRTLRLELREGTGSRAGLGSIASRQGRYRLGHLLNHHVGGPGDAWRNLTPITPSANSNHFYDVESNVKKLVNDHQRWVRYTVTVNYTGPFAAPAPHVHPLETEFARNLTWSYQLKRPNDDATDLVDDNTRVDQIPASDSGTVPNISQGYPD